MSRVTTTVGVDIVKAPSAVFGYLADVARHGEWSPKPYRVEGIAPGSAVEKGTRYTSYGWLPGDKDHRNDVEVTDCEAPQRLQLTADDRGQAFINTFTVTSTPNGSRLERTIDMPKPTGFIGLLFPVILHRVIRPDMTKGLEKLRHKVESA
jgi:uncharacterized protein YndB with AHSA1/START domain